MNLHTIYSTMGETDPTATTLARVASDSTTTATRVGRSVWRLAVHDGDTAATPPETWFVSRLARRLVLTYTRRDEAIIDFDGDAAFAHAANATTRAYVALIRRHRIASLDQPRRPASPIVLRWPRPTVDCGR